MATDWYYKSDKHKEIGPIPAAHLKSLVSKGQIIPSTNVRKGIDGKWVFASNVKGLFNDPLVPPENVSAEPIVPSVSDNSPPQLPIAMPRAATGNQGLPPTLLVGAGIGGTLLVVALIAFAIMFTRGKEKPSQSQIADNSTTTTVVANQHIPVIDVKDVPKPSDPPTKEIIQPKTELSSPEAVVKAYLAATVWEKRLPFVVNADEVRPQMAKQYRDIKSFDPGWCQPGTIVSVVDRDILVGEKCIVSIDVSASYPKTPVFKYAVLRTEHGFKVDWLATVAIGEQERKKDAFQAGVKKLNPIVGVEVLSWKQESPYSKVEFQLSNNSTELISYVGLTMDIYNAKGEFLGSELDNETNLRAGQSVVMHMNFKNVKVDEVASWKLGVKGVSIKWQDVGVTDCTELFELKESKSGKDRGYKIQMEHCLHGHWRETRKDESFSQQGEYFFSATEPKVIRQRKGRDGTTTLTTRVMERNYSTGLIKLELTCPEFTFQFDVKVVDEKTVRTQLTHAAIDGKSARRIDFDPQYSNEWEYVDAKDSP